LLVEELLGPPGPLELSDPEQVRPHSSWVDPLTPGLIFILMAPLLPGLPPVVV
jgi:hypothetical protein